ncbi:hypothetical protein GGR27_003794 [Lewinella antarctica]|uniref:Uncharacterized protein n=1 Tax=Neolewinella antarctica TaxID=442734 RepID=A0ABX0XG28_9BACT|nr:hypothetical protein [Neolewinella antarctica]
MNLSKSIIRLGFPHALFLIFDLSKLHSKLLVLCKYTTTQNINTASNNRNYNLLRTTFAATQAAFSIETKIHQPTARWAGHKRTFTKTAADAGGRGILGIESVGPTTGPALFFNFLRKSEATQNVEEKSGTKTIVLNPLWRLVACCRVRRFYLKLRLTFTNLRNDILHAIMNKI